MIEQQRREHTKSSARRMQRVIDAAMGRCRADIVLKNAAYVNVFTGELCHGDIAVTEGMIAGVGVYSGDVETDMGGSVVLPGFIDSHIHLESAMVSPREFAKAVLPHGTTTVVTDPHEIANVMGTDGIEYILQATEGLPVDVQIMLPSCVPATPKDESGAVLDWESIDRFYSHPRVQGLAEMMNFPGVVAGDSSVLEKLAAARICHKQIDGHAPGLGETELNAYVAAGVRSDHECYELNDALAKLRLGQVIMIREGTAARNLQALSPLLQSPCADRCLFCCDDKHPSDLLEKGHIDFNLRAAVSLGVDPIAAVKAATINAARHFGLTDRGAVAPGHRADLVVVNDLTDFAVKQVYKDGALLFEGGILADIPIPQVDPALVEKAHHTFRVNTLTAADFAAAGPRAVTGHIGLGYITGYGLKRGAVATSVSHDSHNIIVVGANDEDMAAAVNRITAMNGGIVIVDNGAVPGQVELSIAGIMSEDTLEHVNTALESAKEAAFRLGVSRGIDPFMTLSFMALSVIPTLRLTTRGMIDVLTQEYL